MAALPRERTPSVISGTREWRSGGRRAKRESGAGVPMTRRRVFSSGTGARIPFRANTSAIAPAVASHHRRAESTRVPSRSKATTSWRIIRCARESPRPTLSRLPPPPPEEARSNALHFPAPSRRPGNFARGRGEVPPTPRPRLLRAPPPDPHGGSAARGDARRPPRGRVHAQPLARGGPRGGLRHVRGLPPLPEVDRGEAPRPRGVQGEERRGRVGL